MARFALGRRMGSQQRKTILMLSETLDGSSPSSDRVAVFATVSELLSMDVGVTIRTGTANVSKFELRMTARTRDVLMHTSQRKARRGVVVELRRCPDRFPPQGSVADFAGDVYGAVRITRSDGVRGLGENAIAGQ
jgi:hypothetical protein